MFEQSFVTNGGRARTKYTVAFSLLVESMILGVAVLIPLVYSSPLPARQWMASLVAPSPPSSAPRGPAAPTRERARPSFDQAVVTVPTRIPRKVALLDETGSALPAPLLSSVVGDAPGGIPGGAYTGVIGSIAPITQPVPPPPTVSEKPKPQATPRLRIGGDVQKAKQIYAPLPVYPPLARQTLVSGVVRLSAVIGKDGTVQQLTTISGHPLLAPAALEAVARWRYRPTLLNNEPVEVVTQIDVHFMLGP